MHSTVSGAKVAAFGCGGGAGSPEIKASTRVDQLMDATCFVGRGGAQIGGRGTTPGK